jgi:hypothetical protein
MKTGLVIIGLLTAISVSSVCAARQTTTKEDSAQSHSGITPGDNGSVIFAGEYEFEPPPSPWELIRGNDTSHFIFGFYRKDPGTIQLESTFLAYDEEPYGYSRTLDDRAGEFLKRIFWASYVTINILEKKKTPVFGGAGLTLVLEGKDPIKKEKVRSKIVFGMRGERVVAFYINQWRSIADSYDLSAFDTFDRFAGSLRFLKKSFYQAL